MAIAAAEPLRMHAWQGQLRLLSEKARRPAGEKYYSKDSHRAKLLCGCAHTFNACLSNGLAGILCSIVITHVMRQFTHGGVSLYAPSLP